MLQYLQSFGLNRKLSLNGLDIASVFGQKPGKAGGFTLLELLIGGVILILILSGVFLVAKHSSTGNSLSRDLSDGSSKLNTFVENFRNEDPDTLTTNSVQMIVSGTDTTRWILYDNTSAAPYTQSVGIYLLNAKFTWKKSGRVHKVETATLMTSK